MELSIAIPSSYLEDSHDEKIRTYKVGLIGRAASVFRVSKIYIYLDTELDESHLISEILEYMETPQYLRKSLIPIKESLKYAGVLPPLRTPHHPVKRRRGELRVGEIREGYARKVGPNGRVWVDIGVETPALLKGEKREGRVTVRVCSKTPLEVELTEPQDYWGYRVEKVDLERLAKENLLITSRRCPAVDVQELREYLKEKDRICVVFGSPKKGVFDIAEKAGVELEGVCWNFIPNQGTKTVRTEEAVYSALSIINLVRW